jgi:hypothetical protein
LLQTAQTNFYLNVFVDGLIYFTAFYVLVSILGLLEESILSQENKQHFEKWILLRVQVNMADTYALEHRYGIALFAGPSEKSVLFYLKTK